MSIDRRDLMMAGFVLATATVFALVVWLPNTRQMHRIRQDIDAAENELGATRQRTDGLVKLAVDVKRLKHLVNSNHKMIPSSDEMASVLHELSVFIEDQNLTGQGLSTEPTVTQNDYLVMPIEMQFLGDSLSAYEFVHRLESMPRLVQVEQLSMKSTGEPDRQVLTTLKLNTYFTAGEDRSR